MTDEAGTNGAATANGAKSAKKEREFEVVRMADGREVQFSGAPGAQRAQRMKKESLFNDAGQWIGTRFDFRDGRSILFDVARLPTQLADNSGSYDALGVLASHGAEQKFGDSAAGAKTVSDMFDEVDGTIEQVYEGRWTVEREGGSFAGTTLLLRALVEQTGKPVDALRAWLKTKTKEQKDAMKDHPSSPLKPIVERLRAEEAAKAAHVDLGAQFAELDALPAG